MADATEAATLRVIPPGVHLVSTPIGAARDITLRALDVLAGATLLAAEDTRTLRHLMEIHGIALAGRQIVAYHEHNADAALPRLLQALAAGGSVAYASEAGTPMVSDPGYGLVRAAIAAGHPVIAVPGASAVLSALVVSGLPTDRFIFAGFPPTTKAARRTFLQGLKTVPATLILYESPKRVNHLLEDLAQVLGEGRQAVVCRELTKRFEEVTRGTLAELVAAYADRTVKGEIVVLVDRPSEVVVDAQMLEQALEQALTKMTVKDAAAAVAEAFGIPRREVYQMALKRTTS
jgi:16S rRNA (cytidine1402-2'-O)-methyltransferase